MPRKRQNKGFTLVELLVVISIIALLIGILIPAIGRARRSARISVDLASLRQHGIGAATYSASNKGNMPNAQKGSGGGTGIGQISSGPKHLPAQVIVNGTFPHNGIGFGPGYAHGVTWKLYNLVFGDWIVDGAQGIELLNPIFLSSGATIDRENYEALRSVRDGDTELPRFPDGYTPEPGSNDVIDSYFVTQGSVEATQPGNVGFLQPTYSYTFTALVGHGVEPQSNGKYFWGATQGGIDGNLNRTQWNEGTNTWAQYRNWIKASDFAHPSNKVMFWDAAATNSPVWYTARNAICPVVMVDGSARVSTPIDECLDTTEGEDAQKISEAFLAGDFVSTNARWNNGPLTQRPAWFMTGIWGASTRDFGGKGDED